MATIRSASNCVFCGHPGSHARTERPSSGGAPFCEDCDRCWAERQNSDRPPHHSWERSGSQSRATAAARGGQPGPPCTSPSPPRRPMSSWHLTGTALSTKLQPPVGLLGEGAELGRCDVSFR